MNPAVTAEWYAEVPRSIRTQSIAGIVIMVVICGGFGLWAGFAPLASAVIAQGSFVATGKNKIIQHFEGGVIRAIHVNEGDRVRIGQPLLQLDETSARANARQLQIRRQRLDATLARLEGEALGHDTYKVPKDVLDNMGQPDVSAISQTQRTMFRARRLKLQNQIALLKENIAALEFQGAGLTAHKAAMERQLVLLAEEMAIKKGLLKQGLISRTIVNGIERAVADAEGDAARLHSDIQIANTQVTKYRMEIVQATDAYKQTALDEMQTVSAELDAVREQITDAENVLGRTIVAAPVDGIVVRIHYNTAGGVIESGRPVMEILPSDVPLIIEAQIPRMQIDQVHLNQPATVRLSALNQRTTPVLTGKVTYISADAVSSSATSGGNDVYVTRVEIPAEQLQRVSNFSPTPGMPAEVLVQTEERTFFHYLTKPITDSMARAFRED